ncbi:hypothetical protein KDH_31910 [Dictyobacter sp. S3.2.2.5]|uniref:DUF2029 domain-containing protein n=1 Tax=Dictyobacter halimunensis TaxID=3026934 RepID=A0ABQ6FV87_9CHLR|nr:hypothetical protein KDH_31910 [Dictyobacter sp. S3.2.2.5]
MSKLKIPRWSLLMALFLVSVLWLLLIRLRTPDAENGMNIPLVWAMLAGMIPYALSVALVLFTRAPEVRQRQVELIVIIGGGMLLRLLLVRSWPTLSRDVWTYLWDGHMLAHGYNPLRFAPGDPFLAHLRDGVYDQSRYRSSPGIYPIFAQALFWITSIIAPENLTVWKGLLILSDLVSMLGLVWLLRKNRMDPARCVLYAWSPLPIIEFAQNGHLDGIVVMLVVLALCAQQGNRPWQRVLVGVLLGLATWTKLYPALLVAACLRKRDWRMPLVFLGTVFGFALLYRSLAGPGVLGAIFIYAAQVDNTNAGPLVLLLHQMQGILPISPTIISRICMGTIAASGLAVGIQTYRGKLSTVDGVAILCTVFFVCSTHVFPWYLGVFLPLVALGLPRLPYLLLWWCSMFVVSQYLLVGSLHWEHYNWAMCIIPGVILVEWCARRLRRQLQLRHVQAPTRPLEQQEQHLSPTASESPI